MPYSIPYTHHDILFIDAEKTPPEYLDSVLSQTGKNTNIYVEIRAYGDWSKPETQKWASVINASNNECVIRPYQTCGIGLTRAASVATLIADATTALQDGSVSTLFIASPTSDYFAFIAAAKTSNKIIVYIDPTTLTANNISTTKQVLSSAKDVIAVTTPEIIESSENIAPLSAVASLVTTTIDEDSADDKPKRTRGTRGNSRSSKIAKRHAKNASLAALEADKTSNVELESTSGKASEITPVAETIISPVDTPIDEILVATPVKKQSKPPVDKLEKKAKNRRGTMHLFSTNNQPKDPIVFMKKYIETFGKKGADVGTVYQAVRGRYLGFNIKSLGYSRFYRYLDDVDGITVTRENGSWIARTSEQSKSHK